MRKPAWVERAHRARGVLTPPDPKEAPQEGAEATQEAGSGHPAQSPGKGRRQRQRGA